MKRWIGTAVICMNEKNEFLMVLQGKVNEEKRWSVSSGGQEEGEELEECCVREVWEETGYEVEVIDKLCEKKGITYGVPVHVYYYMVKLIGGNMKIQDPDELIHEIDEVKKLSLSFPEGYDLLYKYTNKKEVFKHFLFYCIQDKKSGTITKLAPAVKSIDKLAIVPSTGPISNAFDVPVPFALVPSIIPFASAVLIRHMRMSVGPSNAPVKAVNTTKTAVNCDMPPIISEIAIAIGVVTMCGAKLCSIVESI